MVMWCVHVFISSIVQLQSYDSARDELIPFCSSDRNNKLAVGSVTTSPAESVQRVCTCREREENCIQFIVIHDFTY